MTLHCQAIQAQYSTVESISNSAVLTKLPSGSVKLWHVAGQLCIGGRALTRYTAWMVEHHRDLHFFGMASQQLTTLTDQMNSVLGTGPFHQRAIIFKEKGDIQGGCVCDVCLRQGLWNNFKVMMLEPFAPSMCSACQ